MARGRGECSCKHCWLNSYDVISAAGTLAELRERERNAARNCQSTNMEAALLTRVSGKIGDVLHKTGYGITVGLHVEIPGSTRRLLFTTLWKLMIAAAMFLKRHTQLYSSILVNGQFSY